MRLYTSACPPATVPEIAVSHQLLDKREVRIRRMFGQIAPWYDFLNHLLSFNIDKRWRDRTAISRRIQFRSENGERSCDSTFTVW